MCAVLDSGSRFEGEVTTSGWEVACGDLGAVILCTLLWLTGVKNGITHLHTQPFACKKVSVKPLVRLFRLPINTSCGWLIIATLLAGCGQDDVQVQRVSKDPGAQAQVKALQNSTPQSSARATPTLEWKLPTGWEETTPGEMRFASFRVKGEDGKTADVGVFPLPGMAGGDLENVNRWRGQVGQPAITEEDRAKAALAVSIDGQPAQVYEMAGENAGSGDKNRILAAILRKEGVAWFFKMTGPDALVAAQKPAFIEWLKSLKFGTASTPELPPSHPPIDAGAVAAQAPAAASSPAEGKPQWQVPSGWQEAPGGQFLIAKFIVAGSDNSQASVNVSMSAGDGGGLVSNVNRWRRQLGLSELPDDQVQKLVTAVESEAGKISLVEMSGVDAKTNQKTRLVGAMAPRGGQTWYYKLMGSEQLVEREKNNFINFLKTAKYPNA